jgi:hypothetical protein
MDRTVLEPNSEGVWVIATVRNSGVHERLATVFRLEDGWHAKLTNLHTRHAWSGPYESPEAALEVLSSAKTLQPKA